MENTRTQIEVKRCQQQLPTAWLFKVNDRRRKGLPDLLVLANGVCFAIEAKEVPDGVRTLQQTLRRDTRWMLQAAELRALERAGARCFLMVYVPGTSLIHFYRPDLTPVTHASSLATFLLSQLPLSGGTAA
jgi:hypothetical protein